jgi:carboxymethylenebutenolidase
MKVTVDDGTFASFVARPSAQQANGASIIVLHEIFGVNNDIRATCNELADQGFVGIAPDLFWRESPGLDLNSWSESDWKRGLELYASYDLDRGIHDVAALVRAARLLEGASGQVGVMGFCLGGLMAYLAAARLPIDAAAAYYGGGTDQHLDEANKIAVPLLMHLGEADEFISPQARESIKEALSRKPNVEIFSYPGCSHAFARHTGTHYDASAAAQANERTYHFFKQNLQ